MESNLDSKSKIALLNEHANVFCYSCKRENSEVWLMSKAVFHNIMTLFVVHNAILQYGGNCVRCCPFFPLAIEVALFGIYNVIHNVIHNIVHNVHIIVTLFVIFTISFMLSFTSFKILLLFLSFTVSFLIQNCDTVSSYEQPKV